MARSWPPKDPNDILDYDIDWSRRLDAGETITNAGFVQVNDAGLTILTTSFTDSVAKVWLSGGTGGMTAELTCTINTSAGRQMDKTVPLVIADA